MASIIAHLLPSIRFTCCDHNEDRKVLDLRGAGVPSLSKTFNGRCISRVSICSRTGGIAAAGRCRANGATDLLSVSESADSRSTIEIPVTCYQPVGVSNQAEKDGIVKSVMQLKGAEIEEGYTMDAAVSRQELLMDLRDKLLFEPEYAGNRKISPKASLQIPWNWLPGALCILQEKYYFRIKLLLLDHGYGGIWSSLIQVGEVKLVLEIGCRALQHPDAKPHVHDLILSMALADVRQTSKEVRSMYYHLIATLLCLILLS